jgi:serine/threonine protein kinase
VSTPQSLSVAPIFNGELRLVGGKYRLEERLGEGALGVVYRAVHVGLEKSFAVKLLKTDGAPSPAALARFRREAVALGRLQHPQIVAVTDSGVDEASGIPYLVMEYLEGRTLAELRRDRGALPLAQALPLLQEIADAIDAAHAAGILHRDLKPGNVLITASGVKVLDFGLAELLAEPLDPPSLSPPLHGEEEHSQLTATGALKATPLYAAPELIRHGETSRASDVYSFGVMAYELLGGEPPFRGTVAQVLEGHLQTAPPPLSLPPEVWEALRQPLQKDPALRPATAGEVVRRLGEGAAQAERARWRSTEIPRRVLLASLLSALLLVLALRLPWPPIPPVERWMSDLRVQTAPARAPDPRLLLITFDQASLEKSPLPLAYRADEIADGLAQMLRAGARGVAVDFLLPVQWSASQGFSDLLLRYPDRLTLAAFSTPEGRVMGTECMSPLTLAALGPQRAADLFGFVNLDEDPDGVVRRGRLRFRDRSGAMRPSWAERAARGLGEDPVPLPAASREFPIDTRIDWPRYNRISWQHVPTFLQRNPGVFRNRLVLFGGDFRGAGDDYHRIPAYSDRTRAVSELMLQTLMVNTLTAGQPIREIGRVPVLILAALGVALAMAGLLSTRRSGPIAVWLGVGAGVYVALSFPVFWWADLMLPVTAPLLLGLLGLFVAVALRKLLPAPPEVSP